MALNQLESLILSSCERPESNKIFDLVENFPKYEKCILQSNSFERLCRLPMRLKTVSLHYSFGKVLETLLFYKIIDSETLSPNALIDLINCLISVNENIIGTLLSRTLIIYIDEFLNILLKKDDVTDDDKQLVKNMVISNGLNRFPLVEKFSESEEVEEIIFYVKSKHIEDKYCGVLKLIEFMNLTIGLEEQLELFSKKLPIIIKFIIQDSINDLKMEDLLKDLGKMATTIIGENDFFLKIDKQYFTKSLSNENGVLLFLGQQNDNKEEKLNNDCIICYKIKGYEDCLREYGFIYSTLALIVNSFLQHSQFIELQIMAFKLLNRLYLIYPHMRKNLEDALLTVLVRLGEKGIENTVETIKEISIFLYKVVNRHGSEDFLKRITLQNNVLKIFFDSAFYNEKVFKSHENDQEAVEPSYLIIKTIFPIEITIEAGSSYSHLLEVFQPFSIIYIGFGTQYYDISIQLTLVAFFGKSQSLHEEETILYRKESIDATKNPYRLIYLVRKPGLYRLEFDNKSSWFNQKCIRFKPIVLQPESLDCFINEDNLDSFLEEVNGYDHLEHKEQQKLVKKISMVNTSPDLSRLKLENVGGNLDKLKLLFNDENCQDLQCVIHLQIDHLIVTLKSNTTMKLESEWTFLGKIKGASDFEKLFIKLTEFCKRKQDVDSKNEDRLSISFLFIFNQLAMNKLINNELKNKEQELNLTKIIQKTFEFENHLPKYINKLYYHFIRDLNLYYHAGILNKAIEFPNIDFLKNKTCILYFSLANDNSFFQAEIFNKNSGDRLFQNSLENFNDLSRINYDLQKTFAAKWDEIVKNEKEIIDFISLFLYNVILVNKDKLKLIVLCEYQFSFEKFVLFFKNEDNLKKLKSNLLNYFDENNQSKEINEIIENIKIEEDCIKTITKI